MTLETGAIAAALVAAVALLLLVRRRAPATPQVGGVYSVINGEGGFGIAKVLAVDRGAVHVRLFKEAFRERPIRIDEKTLTLGSVNDPDGFGIGHLPLSKSAFAAWAPTFVKASSVGAEELDGYEEWKSSGGGVWK